MLHTTVYSDIFIVRNATNKLTILSDIIWTALIRKILVKSSIIRAVQNLSHPNTIILYIYKTVKLSMIRAVLTKDRP